MVPIPKQHWHIQLLEVLCDNVFILIQFSDFFVLFFLIPTLREPCYWYKHEAFIFKNNSASPTPVTVTLV